MTTTYANPRKYLVITDAGRAVPVRVKRNPAALAAHFFDLDFRGVAV